ncbi:TetR/AcrR family transcriptional regulator [Streptomyces acidicola]|uniref:TetR/AcrR family transcriptional regulator n=1 Tax=Streptomyces acidicola TaxID=2596892 RepID=UPI0038003956
MPRTTAAQGTASLRQRQKARTRQELLEAALDTFSQVGFGLATVEAIAARAGASKGTVYAHFPDGRDGLFRELYEDLSNRTVERAQQLRQQANDLLSQIRALAQALLEVSSEPQVGLFFSIQGPALGQALEPVTGRASGAFAAMLTQDLKSAAELGTLSSTADPEVISFILVGAMRSAGILVAERPDRIGELTDAIADLARGLIKA